MHGVYEKELFLNGRAAAQRENNHIREALHGSRTCMLKHGMHVRGSQHADGPAGMPSPMALIMALIGGLARMAGQARLLAHTPLPSPPCGTRVLDGSLAMRPVNA